MTTQNRHQKLWLHNVCRTDLRRPVGGNDSHPTGVVKPVNMIQTLPTNRKKLCNQKDTFKKL